MHASVFADSRRWLERQAPTLGVLWLLACGWLDYLSGTVVSMSLFYLPAVVGLAWAQGLRGGTLTAAAAALATTLADLLAADVRPPLALSAWNGLAAFCLFLIVAVLASELRSRQRRLRAALTTDRLTGLRNRQALLAALDLELSRTERFGGDLSLLCIGIDPLQKLMAARGLAATDALLEEFGSELREAVRRTDLPGRLADSDFAVLLTETDATTAPIVADKLAERLCRWSVARQIPVTFSVGWTTAPLGRRTNPDALVARAMAHMFERRTPEPVARPAASADATQGFVAGAAVMP